MREHASSSVIEDRKRDHLAICRDQPVDATGDAGLRGEIHFPHEALPERDQASIDLKPRFLGRRISLPVIFSTRSGGHPQAAASNRALASVAGRHGLALAVGSQRAKLENPERSHGFQLRRSAPEIALAGNLGAVQVRDAGPAAICALVQAIQADGLWMHLNPAQETVQSEGDRDFRGCLAAIAATVETLPLAVIVKQTGCGLSPGAARRLAATGGAFLDVAGAGGTSWTRAERPRHPAPQRTLGPELRSWQALDPRQPNPARRTSEPPETHPSIARGDGLLTRDGHHPTTHTP